MIEVQEKEINFKLSKQSFSVGPYAIYEKAKTFIKGN